ncbi:MAG: thiamine pyrophosphate-dependent enzyme, partial [Planctomycetaceae bacterium]
ISSRGSSCWPKVRPDAQSRTRLQTVTIMISLETAITTLHAQRTDQVVVTTMGSAREWMRLDPHPLDFHFVPSSMGQAPAVGLGIALSQPARRIIVCNGDGCLLMNLGTLVTIAAQAPANLTLLTFDNGMFEVTGGQSTAASPASRTRSNPVDFCNLARSCGFTHVEHFTQLETWKDGIDGILSAPGPVYAHLSIDPVPGAVGPRSPGPAPQRAQRFSEALTAELD